jgi:predicted amidohydrolase YtcJ
VVRYRILTNASFVTDGDRPDVGAVAIIDERIAALGELQEVRRQVGADTETVDLQGATVFPGFSDNHVHVLNFGRSRMGVPCWPSDVGSVGEIVERVRQAHRKAPAGKWLRGRGYDPSRLAEKRAPTADELDLEDDRCVVLDSFDFHRRVGNNAALKAAGIGPGTADPADGEIIRDSHGVPTGELVDGARGLLDRVMPPWTRDEDETAIQIASDHFLSLGFTGVTNAAPLTMSHRGEEVAAFLRLSEKDALRLRFVSMMRAELLEEARSLGLRPGIGGPRFRLGGAKVFADGALGTRTAYLSEEYVDGSGLGMMRMELSELEDLVHEGAASEWQMCVHAQGDSAVEAVAGMMSKYPATGQAPHRIEHCSLTSPSTIQVMAGAGIIPVPQLGFLRYRAADFVDALGEARVARLYPLRSWIDAGLKPIHSSDSPVIADARPQVAIATAMGRTDDAGNTWGPEESVSFAEAVAMMTSWAAAAYGLEHRLGHIDIGYTADFTVFAEDPRRHSADELVDIAPTHTIVGGDTAWQAV